MPSTTPIPVHPDLADEVALLEAAVNAAEDDAAAQAALDEHLARLVAKVSRRRVSRNRRLVSIHPTEAERAEALVEAIGTDHSGEPRYTVADVIGWLDRAEAMGAIRPAITASTIRKVWRGEVVPNAPLRAEVERREAAGNPVGYSALARALGKSKRDTSWVKRLIGVEASSPASGRDERPTLRILLDAGLAARLADALDLPYHDLGV